MSYDDYIPKHCARYYGWLPASKAYKKQFSKKKLKYFTLCAEEAIDIFMFEMEGVLSRDENKKLPNVFICEKVQSSAARIRELVRPPIDEAIVQGPLEQILTFEDNEHTRYRSPDDDDPNRHIRDMLRIKRLAIRLESYFPFDIINFDAFGNLLNPDDKANILLYQSFKKIFEFQKPINTFLLFVTTPITHIHPYFQSLFKSDFENNVSNYSEIKNVLNLRLGTINFDEIDETQRTALCFAKSIVMRAAKDKGWDCEHRGIYVYQNKDLRKILTSVAQFSQKKADPPKSIYIKEVVRIINQMPIYYSYEDSIKKKTVINHLERIRKFRDTSQADF